jgi:hypothetical protein
MPSSEILRHVALIRSDVSWERIPFIIRMARTGKLGRTLAVTSKRNISLQRSSIASNC